MIARWLTLTVISLLACGLGVQSAQTATDQPNVVIILGDDQSWGDYGFMGHPAIQTPSLDRLAEQSLVFTRGYVPSSLCRPSLATLVTGLYPHQHTITGNNPPKGLPRAEALCQRRQMIDYIDKVPTLPRMLAKRGYVSFQSGKWWEGHYSRGGFTDGMTHGDPARGGRHGDLGLKIGREGLKPIFDFVDRAGNRPFFIWYAPFMPHLPHNPPKRLLDKYTAKTDSVYVARYWAMCEWFDETCGRLLDYLDRKDLAGNTLVVYLVDNGWIQQPNAMGRMPRSKRSPYDGGIRTPIMLRRSGRIKPRRDEQTLAISTDLAPTILAACGLEPTADMQGINLLDAEALARRNAIFGGIFTPYALDIHRPASNLKYRWCIEGRSKLIVPNATNVPDGKVELYDIIADPHERHNLAPVRADCANRLRNAIEEWWPAR